MHWPASLLGERKEVWNFQGPPPSRFAYFNLFSALNNLQDLSWDDDYAGMAGFTDLEVTIPLGSFMACLAVQTQQSVAEIQGLAFMTIGSPSSPQSVKIQAR